MLGPARLTDGATARARRRAVALPPSRPVSTDLFIARVVCPTCAVSARLRAELRLASPRNQVSLLDRYLELVPVSRVQLDLVALTSLWLAAKSVRAVCGFFCALSRRWGVVLGRGVERAERRTMTPAARLRNVPPRACCSRRV